MSHSFSKKEYSKLSDLPYPKPNKMFHPMAEALLGGAREKLVPVGRELQKIQDFVDQEIPDEAVKTIRITEAGFKAFLENIAPELDDISTSRIIPLNTGHQAMLMWIPDLPGVYLQVFEKVNFEKRPYEISQISRNLVKVGKKMIKKYDNEARSNLSEERWKSKKQPNT